MTAVPESPRRTGSVRLPVVASASMSGTSLISKIAATQALIGIENSKESIFTIPLCSQAAPTTGMTPKAIPTAISPSPIELRRNGPNEYKTARSTPATPNASTIGPLAINSSTPATAATASRLRPRRAMPFADMMPAWMKREPPV